MENKISGVISDPDMITLEAIPAQIEGLLPFLVTLTKEDRQKLRKMATKNTGYVNDVYTGVKAFPDAMPTGFSIPEFTKDMELMAKLPYIRQIFMNIVERIDDTQMQLGHELMKQADMGYAHMKLAAKDNAPVKDAVDQIAVAYLGQGKKKTATVFTIAAKSTITVSGTVPGTRIVNNGTTVIKFKAGAELAGKVKSVYVPIEPGNSETLPDGFVIIEVANESETAKGSFSVKVK